MKMFENDYYYLIIWVKHIIITPTSILQIIIYLVDKIENNNIIMVAIFNIIWRKYFIKHYNSWAFKEPKFKTILKLCASNVRHSMDPKSFKVYVLHAISNFVFYLGKTIPPKKKKSVPKIYTRTLLLKLHAEKIQQIH